MSDDERNDEKIRQEASGIGNAQAAGTNPRAYVKNTLNYPIEKILFAEVIAAIVLQISINCCGVFSIYSPMLLFLYAPLCFCSPLIFGLNAVYVFVMGFLKKDNKLIILGAISAFLSAAPLMLYFVYRILHG